MIKSILNETFPCSWIDVVITEILSSCKCRPCCESWWNVPTHIFIIKICFIINWPSFNWKFVFKALTCFSASHTEFSVVQFLYSFVVWCVTVALVHNNKLQNLLVLNSSPRSTQDFWKCLWWWKTGLGDFGRILCRFHHWCVRSIPVLSLVSDESSAAKPEEVLPLYRTEWLVLQLCWQLALRRWGTGPEQLKETQSLNDGEPADIQSSCSPPPLDVDFTHLKWEPRGGHFVKLSWWELGWVCNCKRLLWWIYIVQTEWAGIVHHCVNLHFTFFDLRFWRYIVIT